MTPDELDPYHLLASAALDNEVNDDERARLQESPALLNEVEMYRSLAKRVRAVDVPAATRESTIATALAAYDGFAVDESLPTVGELSPAFEELSPATAGAAGQRRGADEAALADIARMRVVRDKRRRQNRWLGGAVAAAFVGTLVVAAINAQSNDNRSTAANSTASVNTASLDTGVQAGSVATKAAPNAAPNAASNADAAGAAPSVAASATTAGANADAAGSAATATATAAGDDPWAEAPSLTDQQQLIAFASGLAAGATTAGPTAAETGAPASTAAAAATVPAGTSATPTLAPAQAVCSTAAGETLVPIIYLGQRVYLVRDIAAREVRILDPGTCAVTATIPLG